MHKNKGEGFKLKLGRYWKYLLLGLALLFSLSLVRNIFRILAASKRIDEAKGRVEKLKDENEDLKRRLAEAQSETYIETQLRDKLGLSKDEEIIVVLRDAETLSQIAPAPAEEEEELPDPTWKKWLKLFL